MFLGTVGEVFKNDFEDSTLNFHTLEVMEDRAVTAERKS